MEYLVTWTIEIEADSHRDAAEEALEAMKDPINEALYFEVRQLSNNSIKFIDLYEEEEPTPLERGYDNFKEKRNERD